MLNRRQWLAALHVLGFVGASTLTKELQAAPKLSPMGERLTALLQTMDQQDLALDPQGAVMRGELAQAHEFGDYLSDDYFRTAHSSLRSHWQALGEIQRAELAVGPEQVAYDMVRYQLHHALRRHDEGHTHFAQQMPIDHLFGQHISFAQFSSGQGAPFKTLKDYENGLARFEGFVIYIDRAIERMRQGMQAGRVLPRLVTERVLAQLDAALNTAAEDSPYFGPIKALPETLTAADRQRLTSAYRSAINDSLTPALRKLAHFMRHAYLPASRAGSPGVGALPGGPAYYEYQLETMTTLRLPAQQMHRTGLAEVARVRADMQHIQHRLGFKGRLAQFFAHLRDDPKYKFAKPEDLLTAYRQIGERVDKLLPRWFEKMPTSRLEIRPVPPVLESSAGGAYYQVGSADGSRPGVFYDNTSQLPTRTSLRLTALYLHEALPGHHLQGSLAQEAMHLPPLLRFTWNVGYGEGWALYCEWLGHEMGLYDDPVQHFGQLDMEMFRAVRLVVDTGLHALGWSRQRAVDYVLANTSLDRPFVEQEVDRYIAWPGQATAYKVGELALKRLRRTAQRRLGTRFDRRRFHSQVLDTGALPLAVLEMKINQWIKENLP